MRTREQLITDLQDRIASAQPGEDVSAFQAQLNRLTAQARADAIKVLKERRKPVKPAGAKPFTPVDTETGEPITWDWMR